MCYNNSGLSRLVCGGKCRTVGRRSKLLLTAVNEICTLYVQSYFARHYNNASDKSIVSPPSS